MSIILELLLRDKHCKLGRENRRFLNPLSSELCFIHNLFRRVDMSCPKAVSCSLVARLPDHQQILPNIAVFQAFSVVDHSLEVGHSEQSTKMTDSTRTRVHERV